MIHTTLDVSSTLCNYNKHIFRNTCVESCQLLRSLFAFLELMFDEMLGNEVGIHYSDHSDRGAEMIFMTFVSKGF